MLEQCEYAVAFDDNKFYFKFLIIVLSFYFYLDTWLNIVERNSNRNCNKKHQIYQSFDHN